MAAASSNSICSSGLAAMMSLSWTIQPGSARAPSHWLSEMMMLYSAAPVRERGGGLLEELVERRLLEREVDVVAERLLGVRLEELGGEVDAHRARRPAGDAEDRHVDRSCRPGGCPAWRRPSSAGPGGAGQGRGAEAERAGAFDRLAPADPAVDHVAQQLGVGTTARQVLRGHRRLLSPEPDAKPSVNPAASNPDPRSPMTDDAAVVAAEKTPSVTAQLTGRNATKGG